MSQRHWNHWPCLPILWMGKSHLVQISFDHQFQHSHSKVNIHWLVISIMLQNTKTNDICHIIAIIYNIWHARNLLVFQNKDIPVMNIVRQATSSSREFQATIAASNKFTKPPTVGSHGHNNYWTPPPRTTLKLNVDAHPCGDGRWGLGLVLCTERGKCVGAMTKVVWGSENIVDGEAYGPNVALNHLEAFVDTCLHWKMVNKR
jgi:hypothetical protein